MKIIQRMISFCMVLALLIGMVPPMAVNAEEMTAEAVDPAVVTVTSSEPILIPTESPEETSEHTVETTASAERATEPVEETLASTEALTEPAEEAEEEPVREEAAAATSGTCGKNLTWNLTDGVLTISGTGAMTGYSTSSSAPWFSERMGITAVVIEAGVTSIGSHAFYYCVNMVSVTIPDTVESIGSSAFYECTALESVEIPHGVKYVSSYTFYNCTSLESVTIPDSVTEISYGAFYNCSGLAEINIPGSVTYIGGYVFMGCTALKSLVIPEGVTSVSSELFYGCTSLESVTIPDSVTSIDSNAFYGCTKLEGVIIPAGVTSIGNNAFYNCSSLSAIKLPEGITGISSGTFYGCSGLEEIAIPRGVVTIGGSAFYGCTGLSSVAIPEGVVTIGGSAFYGCTQLSSVAIPEGVTTIYSSAFYGCTGLSSVAIPEGVTTIESSAFYGCTSLTSIDLPESVTAIGSSAFYGCTSLTSIDLPNSLTAIGSSAFSGCTSLASMDLPESLTSIGSYAFNKCKALAEITVPGGVTAIAYDTFEDCSGLKTVVISEGVTSIANDAFWGCTGLETVSIPGTVAEIQGSTFSGKTNLKTVRLGEGVTTIGGSAFSGCTSLASMDLPESLTSIGNDAFSGCTSLASIDLPENLASIGGRAFYNCDALVEITVPGGVTAIAYDTFENCSGLKTVVISEGVTSIANDAFWGCTGLETVSIPGTVAEIQGSTFSGKTNLKTVTLGEGVTTIGNSAFSGCTSLASMDLPESLTSIGGSAFYNCKALAEITVPGGVTEIAYDTFENCSGLKTVVISEGVTSIGGSAFSGCTSLTSVALPESLTSIGGSAFYNCKALAEITVPGGVTEIANDTFQDCSGLKTVVISEGVTSIANDAFWGCTGLETVSIPGTVDVIQEGTFSGRANLKTVTLGEGVTTIGSNAFYDCDALVEITIPASVTCIDDAAFAYCSNLTEIYFGHLSSAELVMAYNAFYLNGYDDYKDVPTVVYVPYARDIHSAISGYAWADYGRDVRFASSGCLPAQTVTIEAHQAQMEAGLEMTLTAAMDPWYCTSDLVWEVIPGTGEASIDQNGVLLGLEPGFVTVRCVSTDDVTVFDETQIEILAPTAYVSAITIRCDGHIAAEVEEGGSVRMLAQIEPGNAMDKRVTWEVENGSGKATITEDGVLSGIATGTVTVYATARDGTEVMGSLVVEVVRYVTDITICLNGKADTAQLGVGEKAALSAVVTPENANYTDVTWQLENGTGQAELTGDRYNRGLKGIASGTVILKAVSADSRKLTVSKEIEIVGEKLPYAVTGGNLYYNSVTGSIVGCDETVTNANIPGIIAGTRITAIAPDAFYDHDRLASVTIPSSVETIGNYAFYDCEGLSSLRINGSGLKTVGRSAFEYCRSLTNLTIPEGVTEIGYGAFDGLSGLKNLIIPGDLDCRDWLSYNGTLESLTLTGSRIISTANYELHEDGSMNWWGDTVGRDAKTVIIRDSVEEIEEFAFLGCDDLKTVTIGSGVKDIERYAFYDCDALETITMGSKVKTIGKSAFESCGKLREVTLPEGIESLGESCFSRCSALEKINLPDSLKTIGRRCFAIESENGKLQLIDLSGNPTQMKEQELQLSYKIPTVLVTATNNKSRLWWDLAYTHEDYEAGKPDPYEIAWIDGETGMLRARGSGTVTVVCSDEYTGAEGRWTIEVSAGVVIRSEENRNYVVSGETLQLSAWMMPANEAVDVAWTLRPQDTAYATISENGKVTAKSVSGAHQIEVTAHPGNGSESVTIALWVVPKTTGLYIYEGSGDVTGSELSVDMAQIPSIQLTAVAQPEDAVGDVAWKTSAETVASVDGGLVTFNSPGRVTITAAAADGSGKTASVTFSVTYRDTAKTLTAILDAPNNTLQSGQSARIHVYGADPDNALDTALLEFGVPDSQKHIATVDETGLVTAGETAGTVTVTAALKGDPLGRRVNVKITVIARQTEKLVLRTDAPAPAQVQMLDETGRITTDAAAAANYVVLLSKRDVAEEAYTFVITPEAYTAAGSSNPGKAGLKWATSNSKLATVSVCDDGTALVTVKESADGACIISAVTTDDAKLENRLTINVRDYAPRLETLKPTLNTNLSQAAVLGLVESYGNAIRSVALYENGEVSARLKPVYEDGLLTIAAETYIPNATLELVLKVACADGLVYEYQLKAKVKNAAPGITVKQLEKFNLFYLDSAAALSVSAKDAVITHVELEDTFDFVAEFDAETGEAILRYSDRYVDDHSVKADTKATLLVYMEGYGQPARKSITIATVSKKPSVQTNLNASVINTAVAGEKTAAFGFVLKGTTQLLNLENARVDVTADFAQHRIQDDQVVLTLKGAVGGTATVLVQLENWLEAIKLTHKVTVESKTPTLKLGTGTLKLNSVFSAQTDETPVSLSQSNLDIGWIDFTSTAAVGTAARTEADKLNLSYDALSGKVVAAISDPDNAPKAGSYVFTAVASLSDGTALGAVKLKVTVAATAPKIKLKASTLKLNKVLSGEETAVTDVTLTKGEGYTLIGFKELADWNHETVWLDFVDGQLTAQLVDADAAGKTSSFKLTPILRHDATGQESELPATVSLKVQVYSNDIIAVSLSAKGKLDAIDPNSEIRYTISKITNACGSVTGVSLEGADADRFDAVLNEDGTVSLKLVSGEEYSVKQTYKVQFSFTICGREVLSPGVSFKVTQSALKFTVSPANCCLYQSQTMPLTVRLNLAGPEGARLENITLGAKSSQAFLDAMAGGDMDVTVSEDGRSAVITFDVRNAASLAFGKRYVLYLDVTAEGGAADAKTNQVKLTVQVEK